MLLKCYSDIFKLYQETHYISGGLGNTIRYQFGGCEMWIVTKWVKVSIKKS